MSRCYCILACKTYNLFCGWSQNSPLGVFSKALDSVKVVLYFTFKMSLNIHVAWEKERLEGNDFNSWQILNMKQIP